MINEYRNIPSSVTESLLSKPESFPQPSQYEIMVACFLLLEVHWGKESGTGWKQPFQLIVLFLRLKWRRVKRLLEGKRAELAENNHSNWSFCFFVWNEEGWNDYWRERELNWLKTTILVGRSVSLSEMKKGLRLFYSWNSLQISVFTQTEFINEMIISHLFDN